MSCQYVLFVYVVVKMETGSSNCISADDNQSQGLAWSTNHYHFIIRGAEHAGYQTIAWAFSWALFYNLNNLLLRFHAMPYVAKRTWLIYIVQLQKINNTKHLRHRGIFSLINLNRWPQLHCFKNCAYTVGQLQ